MPKEEKQEVKKTNISEEMLKELAIQKQMYDDELELLNFKVKDRQKYLEEGIHKTFLQDKITVTKELRQLQLQRNRKEVQIKMLVTSLKEKKIDPRLTKFVMDQD